MELVFKILGPDDAALLSQGTDQVFDHDVKPELARRYLARDDYVIAVALEGEAIVGMASGFTYFHPDKDVEFFVNECGTHDDYLRRGIAKKLMRMVLEWADAQGCRYKWLGTETDNVAANALYRSLGAKGSKINFYEWGDMG